MLETVKALFAGQFDAALSTLNACIVRCPDAAWDTPVANLAFCQVAFHTLFFTDYYLGTNADGFRDQPFHREHADFFRDYEELEDRAQTLLYDKPTIRAYVGHCREKAARVIAAETEQTLAARADFARRTISRAEMYPYVTRHVQHHAAQLGLLLRRDHDIDLPWFESGWRD